MKAQPLTETTTGYSGCEPKEATHVLLCMPGPTSNLVLPVRRVPGKERPTWTWNGNTEAPTLTPSILTRWKGGDTEHRCHSFVTDGRVRFLSDCTHELAGQVVDLLEVDWS